MEGAAIKRTLPLGPTRAFPSRPATNPKTKTAMATKYAPPTQQNRPAGSGGSGPIKTIRLGRIKAAVWENGSEERTFCNVKFTRTYMDEQKKFHDADTFGRDDLLALSKLADQAHTFICERQSGARSGED